MDKWSELITEDGDDFETVAKVSLQMATWFMETALLRPEWAKAFIYLASPIKTTDPEEGANELTHEFPVAMDDEQRERVWATIRSQL